MNVFGIPDALSFSRLAQNVADLKSRVDTSRTESVTGRVEDVTKELDGDVGGAHILKKAVEDAQLFQQNLAVAKSRAEITQTTMGNIGSDSSRIATDLLAAVGRGADATIDVIADDARASLTVSFAALNTVLAGRALFGGDATQSPPLAPPEQLLADIEAIVAGAIDAADAQAQIDFYFNDPAGGFATNIYQGGANRAPFVEIAPGTRVDVSVKANDEEIKDIIQGLVTIAVSDSATFPDRYALLTNGANQIFDAEARLIDLRAAVGVNEGRIADAIERYENEESVMTTLFNEKTLRDPFEAASQLQLLESQLEASYLLTARMSRLSLANFLR
ncbi:MAG: hypothetical protein ACX939_03445 [Hyphococcus sp.]